MEADLQYLLVPEAQELGLVVLTGGVAEPDLHTPTVRGGPQVRADDSHEPFDSVADLAKEFRVHSDNRTSHPMIGRLPVGVAIRLSLPLLPSLTP